MGVMMMGEIHLGDVWIIGGASPWPAGWNIYHLIWRTMHNVHCTWLIEQLDFVVEIKLPDETPQIWNDESDTAQCVYCQVEIPRYIFDNLRIVHWMYLKLAGCQSFEGPRTQMIKTCWRTGLGFGGPWRIFSFSWKLMSRSECPSQLSLSICFHFCPPISTGLSCAVTFVIQTPNTHTNTEDILQLPINQSKYGIQSLKYQIHTSKF